MEEFRDIEGYEGLYQVSNLGRVKSLSRIKTNIYGIKYPIKERILKHVTHTEGYLSVALCINGKPTTKLVHRLVGQAFLLKDIEKAFINHKNGIKIDNRLDNLEWCTTKENNQHSHDLNLSKKGVDHPNSKLLEKDIFEIRNKLKHLSQTEVSEIYGVSQTLISKIKRNKIWKHL